MFARSVGGGADVVVVGAGIAGCTVARELALVGARVVVCERTGVGAAASGRNTGTLLQQAEPEVRLLLDLSLEVYRELIDGPIDFELQQRPQLLLARDEQQLALCRTRADAIKAGGHNAPYVTPEELVRSMPQLAPDLAGGYVVDEAWTLNAGRATAAFARAAREAGVEFQTGTAVLELQITGGLVRGVVTDHGSVNSDAVVLATGPWLPEFAGDVKVAPGRGWLIRTDTLPFKVPWIIEEISWPDQEELGRGVRYPTLGEVARGRYNKPAAEAFVVAPQPGGEALVGASLAPSLLESPDRLGVPEEMARRALQFAPGFEGVAVRAAWYAHRPMSLDGLPITGPVAGTNGLFVHAGHGSLGMQAAPATARWLASHMAGRMGHPGLEWLDPARESLTGYAAR